MRIFHLSFLLTASLVVFSSDLRAEPSVQPAASLYQVLPVQQGEVKFTLTPQEIRALHDAGALSDTAQKSISCQADIKTVVVDEKAFPDSKRLNDIILAQAKSVACAKEFREVRFTPESIVLENNLLSILFYRLQYPAGGNGSCHGGWQTLTADVRGGYVYVLSDLLDERQLPAFYVYLQEKLSQLGEADSHPSQESVAAIVSDLKQKPDRFGFYLQNGKLFLQVNSFLLSCAEGNHFPVEIPLQFIRKSVLTSPFINILAETAKVP